MKALIIGDIHGCHRELLTLLEKAGVGNSDVVISLGDLVDRGPNSPAVLSFFQTRPNTFALLGNHERKHVRADAGELPLNLSQYLSRDQFGEGYPSAVSWMRTLPLYLELPEALLVHGYLEPDIPLVDQKSNVLTGTMSGGAWLEARYDQPWYRLYQCEKPVIVGHHSYTGSDQAFIFEDRIFGLDTNCVHGGKLTGLILPSFDLVQVDCEEDYWSAARQAFFERKAAQKWERREIAWDAEQIAGLDALVELAQAAAQALLARLEAEPGYRQLNTRESMKRFSDLVPDKLLLGLLHQARLGYLDAHQAKKIIRDPAQLAQRIELLRQMLGEE
jgi:serine/threonine protein phosphatase 1